MPPDSDVRGMVRRDLQFVLAGVLAALVAFFLLVAARLDLLGDRAAATVIVLVATAVGFSSFVRWLAGPVELRRDRYFVLAPAFLIALPGLLSLNELGGGLTVILFSSLVGFSAAIAGGLALSSRRAR
jgi:hypothetical protein